MCSLQRPRDCFLSSPMWAGQLQGLIKSAMQVTTLLGRVAETEKRKVSADQVEVKRKEVQEKQQGVASLNEACPTHITLVKVA